MNPNEKKEDVPPPATTSTTTTTTTATNMTMTDTEDNDNDSNDYNTITVTLIHTATGQSETLPLSARTTTVAEFMEWTHALFSDADGNTNNNSNDSNNNSNDSNDSNNNNNNNRGYQYVKLEGQVLLFQSNTAADESSSSTSSFDSIRLQTLEQVGIVHGDVLAIAPIEYPYYGGDVVNVATATTTSPTATTRTTSTSSTSSTSASLGGGLDFSQLLQQPNVATAISSSTTATAAAAAAATITNTTTTITTPPPQQLVYHSQMNLQEAQYYNPHPENMVTLLYQKDHLLKELNYYHPTLAQQLRALLRPSSNTITDTTTASDANTDTTNTTTDTDTTNTNTISPDILARATQLYRQSMVQSSIQTALRATTQYHHQQSMTQRIQQNPNDTVAQDFFQQQQQLIQEQYQHVMEQYPESAVGRVLMLYIPIQINGHAVQAFCDSGAQQTIMSKRLAIACDIYQYVDRRMKGIAVGVGTGIILGRIHMVQIQINQSYYFPCSITVMDDPPTTATSSTSNTKLLLHDNNDSDDMQEEEEEEAAVPKEMPFLLGLDMMKRHLCCLDMREGCIRFSISEQESITVPFLHEKDLLPAQGGTKSSVSPPPE
jgi:hypothetical protein